MKKLFTQYFSNRDETEFHRLVRLEHLHEFVNNHNIPKEDIECILPLTCEYGAYGYQLFYWAEKEYNRTYVDVSKLEESDCLRKDEQYRRGLELSNSMTLPEQPENGSAPAPEN